MLSLLILPHILVGFLGIAVVGFFAHSARLLIFVFSTNATLVLLVRSDIGFIRLVRSDIGFVFFRSPTAAPRNFTSATLDDHSLVGLMIDIDRVWSLVLHDS